MNVALAHYSLREGLYNGDPGEGCTYWQSMRRCPKCKRLLSTNGIGDFTCLCGFADKQDVAPLREKGLDYPYLLHDRGASAIIGKKWDDIYR